MSHTPGPWVIDYEGTVGHIKAFVGDKTPTVCKYGTDYRGERHSALEIEHQDEANARLIAAAPGMHEAIKNALRHIRSIQAYDDSVAVPKAFAISALHEGLKSAGIENLASI